MTREPLPNRRPCVTFETEWQGHRITVTVGQYPDPEEPWLGDAPGDVFADLEKDGPLAAILDDAARLASIAMQHGATPEDLAHSMGQLPVMEWSAELGVMIEVPGKHGPPASPIGAIMNALRGLSQ